MAQENFVLLLHPVFLSWATLPLFPAQILLAKASFPAPPFTVSELQNLLYDITELHKINRFLEVEALKL